jgi:hypothetical protein
MTDLNPEFLNPELKKRLSSWREVAGVVEHSPDSIGESSINEAQVRQRQRRAESMLLHMLKGHDAFYAALKAHIEQGGREGNYQQRIEDMSAFALGVFEQFSAENIHNGLRNELENLPKEIIQTITVPAPQPPKSWFQRLLFGS